MCGSSVALGDAARSCTVGATHARAGGSDQWRVLSRARRALITPKEFADQRAPLEDALFMVQCVACGTERPRSSFSATQLRKPPDCRRCLVCVAAPAAGETPPAKVSAKRGTRTRKKKTGFEAQGPYLSSYFANTASFMVDLAEFLDQHPIPEKTVVDEDTVDKRTKQVQLSDTSWETEEERVAEAAVLKDWDAKMIAFLDANIPCDAPKAHRDTFTTTDGHTISMEKEQSQVFDGFYLACTCQHFHNQHVTGRPQAGTCPHLLQRNGEETERKRVYTALKRMIRKGYRPMRVGQQRLVLKHIITTPDEPKRSAFRWNLYKTCGCPSWVYANGTVGNMRPPKETGHAHPTQRTCKHLRWEFGDDAEYRRHTWAVASASRQAWVPVIDRPTKYFEGKDWACTCPSFASAYNQARLLKRCKHIDGIHADLDGVPLEQRGPRGYKPSYADGTETVTLADKFYYVNGSNGERYLVSWMAHDEDVGEFARAKEEKLKALYPSKDDDDESDPDDW